MVMTVRRRHRGTELTDFQEAFLAEGRASETAVLFLRCYYCDWELPLGSLSNGCDKYVHHLYIYSRLHAVSNSFGALSSDVKRLYSSLCDKEPLFSAVRRLMVNTTAMAGRNTPHRLVSTIIKCAPPASPCSN